MPAWVRLLRRASAVAAALAVMAALSTQLGAVFVGGWSMAPAFVPGDLAIYRRGAEPHERDAALIAVPGDRPFVHRVLAIGLDGSLRTKGDANERADGERASRGDVAGVVVAVLPTGRAVHALVATGRWCYNHAPIANTRR